KLVFSELGNACLWDNSSVVPQLPSAHAKGHRPYLCPVPQESAIADRDVARNVSSKQRSPWLGFHRSPNITSSTTPSRIRRQFSGLAKTTGSVVSEFPVHLMRSRTQSRNQGEHRRAGFHCRSNYSPYMDCISATLAGRDSVFVCFNIQLAIFSRTTGEI